MTDRRKFTYAAHIPERRVKEADITKAIRDVLNIPARAGKLWYFKVAGGPLQRPGIPDIIGCYKGRFFAIEVKRPGYKATDKQKAELRAIKEAGGIAIVAYDPAWVVEALDLGFEIMPLFRREGLKSRARRVFAENE